MKDRLLVLLKTLQEQSDEASWLNTGDLRAALEKEGHECSVRTLRRDMKALQNCGYNIAVQESSGRYTKYSYRGRKLSNQDLQILVDATASALFVPLDRRKELVRRLSGMTGPSYEKKMHPRFRISEPLRAKDSGMIDSLDYIYACISWERQISFTYVYRESMSAAEESEEKILTVSPYLAAYYRGLYYLVGREKLSGELAVFRVDRMKDTVWLNDSSVPPPEEFDARSILKRGFWYEGGPEETVTLRCSAEILAEIRDQFGADIELKNVQENSFEADVPVCLNSEFYAWVFRFARKLRIVAPEYVREAYTEHLKEALEKALGE